MITVRRTTVFDAWIEDLPDKIAAVRILARIVRLAQGNPGDVRPVGEGISELRIDYGPGYRVYFVQRRTVLVILLCGGAKRTQARDIARAKDMAGRLGG